MNIAAQLKGKALRVFIEGISWQNVTKIFDRESVTIGLAVYYEEGEALFHDAICSRESDTHFLFMFCREELTVTDFKSKLRQAGYSEPYEIKFSNGNFDLKKVFPCAYALTFHNYISNAAFFAWLGSLYYPEADLLLKGLLMQGRYFSLGYSEFKEFKNIEAFINRRFEIWHEDTVKEFEKAMLQGKAHCPGCDI